MAEESGQEKSVSDLKQEIAHSRDWLARDLGGLRYELDFPLKFRRSFQRQMLVWVAAALVIGLAFSVMPARTKVIRVNSKGKGRVKQREGILGAGLAIGALRFAATLLKPVIVGLITKKMGGIAGERHQPRKW